MMTLDASQRIVRAAEQLFAEGGEDATSLRAITRRAGVNVAAIHYHFGGRDELLRAILDLKIGPLNEHRLLLLDEAEASYGEPVPVQALLRAFLLPDLHLLASLRESGQFQFCRFMGRAYTEPSPAVAGFVNQQFAVVSERFMPLLSRALPQVPATQLHVRMRMVVAVVTVMFANAAPPGQPGMLGSDDIDEQLDSLLSFLTPGLVADSQSTRSHS